MSSAREGLLPVRLARRRRDDPVAAIAACTGVFLAVIGAVAWGWTSIANLLVIAGQNFFLLYLVCTLAYSRLFRGGRRIAGIILPMILSVIAAVSFGAGQAAYATVLFLIGAVLVRCKGRAADARGHERLE